RQRNAPLKRSVRIAVPLRPTMNLTTILLVVAGAVLAIPFTYFLGQLIFREATYLPQWADRNGNRILHQEARYHFRGPFWLTFRCSPVYRVTVEDSSGRHRRGWVHFGLFSGKATERWQE